MRPYDAALAALRSRPATFVARTLTSAKLRILAYHGVPDSSAFEAQMAYLAANFTPVDEQAVARAFRGEESLPDGAAWVTFDDGDPTVVNNGLATLSRLGIPATMYVCPGLIEPDAPFWWRVTDWATRTRPERADALSMGHDLTEYAKTVDDRERRHIVEVLLEEMAGPTPDSWRQLDENDLARWTGSGMALGNHSWDHPCLDQCEPQAQRDQIAQTHAWLSSHLGRPPLSFAYPNGNFSPIVDQEVRRLGYDLAVLYDNQLTSIGSEPLRLSRLMLEADEPVPRLVGVLSGAQPALARVAQRFGR